MKLSGLWVRLFAVLAMLIAASSQLAAGETAVAPEAAKSSAKATQDGTTIIYPNAEKTPWVSDKDGSAFRGQLAYVFIILMAGGALFLWFWKRKQSPSTTKPGNRLSIQDIRPLGAKQFLAIAAYDEQKFLIAISPGRIALLSKLEPSMDASDDLDDDEDS